MFLLLFLLCTISAPVLIHVASFSCIKSFNSTAFVQVCGRGDWKDGAVLLAAWRAFLSGGEHARTHRSRPGAGGTAQRRAASKYFTHTRACTLYKMGQDADCPRTRWLNVILCVCVRVCVLAMQGHLAQQQKAMAEEKAYLKDIISRMDTQLKEQQRQLEKVIMRNNSNRPRSYAGTCCSSASTKNVTL